MKALKGKKPAAIWLGKVAGKKKIYIAGLLFLQLSIAIVGVMYAVFLKNLIDRAVEKNMSGFISAAISVALLIALQVAIGMIGRFLKEWARASLENLFKSRLFSCLLRKDYGSVTGVHTGEWMNRLTSDTVVVANGMTDIVPGAAGMAVRLVGAIVVMFFLEPHLVYILIPGGCFLLLFTYGFRKVLKLLHKQVQEADGKTRMFMQERLQNLMIVRSFVMESRTEEEAGEKMQEHLAVRIRRNHLSNLCNTGFSVAMHGAYLFGAVYCGYEILNGRMSYGTLMAILQLINQICSPIANITGYLPQYYAMIASAERLMEAEEYSSVCEKTIELKDALHFYDSEFGGLGLRDVFFTYHPPVHTPGHEMQGALGYAREDSARYSLGKVSGYELETAMPVVLSGINLEIKKGEYVAFTGHSGCGKSTILKLLMCLYPLDGGERYIIGRTKLPLTFDWRNLFAYVPQGNQLMSGTIREILTFGVREKMGQEDMLRNALMLACADEFVDTLENGLDTVLGEGGTGLSEGQMQRIAIARAIFSGHPILLLDESTSALDEATEERLLINLKSMTDRTVLIVTHRSKVLAICDRQIHVTENGVTECTQMGKPEL